MVTPPRAPAQNGYGHGRDVTQNDGQIQFLFFSELFKRPVRAGSGGQRIGKLTDVVCRHTDPFPEAIGIHVEPGWGNPAQLIPWSRVTKIEDDEILVHSPTESTYPPFVDEPGWILVDTDLMGRTILDIDERQVEVVNDVRFLHSHGRLLLVDVDVSFQGFLRRWRVGRLTRGENRLISWKYVQPLSLEDAVPSDRLKLSITREQLQDLPAEDLADALEELTGTEQQALFSALEPETAAESLIESEPRVQRQVIEDLAPEQGRIIFAEMTALQVANVFAALSQEKQREVVTWLSPACAEAVRHLLSERDATAKDMISSEFVVKPASARVGDVMGEIRSAGYEPRSLSYIYIVGEQPPVLEGIVDLRDLVLARDEATMGDIMASPVVSAPGSAQREDLEKMFEKYGFGMIPVVDEQDRILGVIRYRDIMKAPELNT